MKLFSELLDGATELHVTVDRIHIGGGTPHASNAVMSVLLVDETYSLNPLLGQTPNLSQLFELVRVISATMAGAGRTLNFGLVRRGEGVFADEVQALVRLLYQDTSTKIDQDAIEKLVASKKSITIVFEVREIERQ